MSELKNFVLTQDINRGRQPYKRKFDIIPNSWIFKEKINSKFKCYYPSKPWTEVESMVRELEQPDKSWDIYTIKCLYNTGKYS